nr:hypothetical protein [Tanacetum cinerariifolium]
MKLTLQLRSMALNSPMRQQRCCIKLKLKTRRNLVLAAGDPAGSIVSTAGVPTGSVPAGSVPAGGVLAGSVDSAGFGDPATSESVPAIFNPDLADNSTFPLASSVAVDLVATKRVNTIHPQSQIIEELQSPVQTRSKVQKSKFGEKPSSMSKALKDPHWVAAMQEEMQQFFNQQVWKLVPLPNRKIAIGTKWILKNKRDARGIVVRNKARLVAQGHRQEVGIDYDEVFAPVDRIEAITLFLAFALYMGFMVYQMDVKSAFLYGVVKALYGLHQAPRAWYARLSTILLKHYYRRCTIDKTLFIKKDSRHIILVQVYVDNIIFGSTNKAWCDEFEVLMKGEFEMSAICELTFFLGLQVTQLPDEIFISQDKSMIGSLMYLTASKPDIMFAVYGTLEILLFQLEAYSDSDYVGSYGDRKSTTGGCQFLGRRPPMLLVVQVFLLVVLVHADGLVPAGSYTIPTGKDVSNSFMAVMVCQKPLGYFSSPMIHVPRARLVIHPPGWCHDSTKGLASPRVSSYLVKAYKIYLCCCEDQMLLFHDPAVFGVPAGFWLLLFGCLQLFCFVRVVGITMQSSSLLVKIYLES